MGAGLKGRRDKVFLMTKTCPHGRDASLALQMLEESLHRLQTDHLDLWQVHGMAFDNDPELFIRSNGAAEALTAAKQQGKVRFIGSKLQVCPSKTVSLKGCSRRTWVQLGSN
jgi:aryl-alcohol dehydrogenase-like predicted oxidoreductase